VKEAEVLTKAPDEAHVEHRLLLASLPLDNEAEAKVPKS
jgi:hypothetical protein